MTTSSKYLFFFFAAASWVAVSAQSSVVDKAFKASGANADATQLDSLLALLPNVNVKDEPELLCMISRLYRENDAEKAIEFTQKSIERIEALKDSVAMARIYEIFGHTLNVQANYKAASRYFTKALKILEVRKDTLSLARKYHLMAYTATLGGKNSYEGTISYLSKSFELFKSINNQEGMGYTSYGLGQALYNEAADKDVFPRLDSRHRDSLLFKSLEFSIKAENYYEAAKLNDRMAGSIVSQAEVYQFFHQSELAKKLLLKAYAIHQREGMLMGMARCMWKISDLYLEQKKPDSAIFFLNESAIVLEKIKIYSDLTANYDEQTGIYKVMGNFAGALRTSEVARKHREKSFANNRENELAEIRGGYESQLKDSRIQDLETKSLLDKAAIRQQTIITTGILIALFITIALGSLAYRQRQKSVKQLNENIKLNSLLQGNLQDKLHDSELIALKAQMNPHFVFNSINAIQNLILKENKTEAITYLNDFSKLTRETLENSAKETITLEEEIRFLNHYLQLENLRSDNKFDYEISCEPGIDISFERIPPMLIQPFVENAVKHGIMPKPDRGIIRITFQKGDESILSIFVEDDGIGREASGKLKKEHERHHSMAILLTETRMQQMSLKKLLNQQYQVSIEDRLTTAGLIKGTKVIILVPFSISKTLTA